MEGNATQTDFVMSYNAAPTQKHTLSEALERAMLSWLVGPPNQESMGYGHALVNESYLAGRSPRTMKIAGDDSF